MLAQVFLPLWPWVERVVSVPWSKSGPKSGLYNPHFVQTWGFSLPPYRPFRRPCKTWVKIKQETCNYHGGWLTLPRKNNNTLMSIEGFQWDSKTSITTQGFACSLVHAQWLWGKVRATIEQDTSFTCKLPQQFFNDFLDNSRIIHHFQQAGKKMMVANTHKADVGCI